MLTRAGRVAASLSSYHPPSPRNQGCIGCLHVSTSMRGANSSASSIQTRSVTTKNTISRTRSKSRLGQRMDEEGLGDRGKYEVGEGPNSEILRALIHAQRTELARLDRDRYKLRSLNRAIREIGYLGEALDAGLDWSSLKGKDQASSSSNGKRKGKANQEDSEKELEMQKILEERVNTIKWISVGIRRLIVRFLMGKPDPLLMPSIPAAIQQSPAEDEAQSSTPMWQAGPDAVVASPGPRAIASRAKEVARRAAVSSLLSVPSIGQTTARHLVTLGVRSVEELIEMVFPGQLSSDSSDLKHPSSPPSPKRLKPSTIASLLTPAQLTHLRFHSHLIQPVTRSEIESVIQLVEELLPKGYKVIPTGSYRRGFPISARIDLCLVHPLLKDVPALQMEGSIATSTGNSLPPDRRGRTDLFFRSPFISTKARKESRLLNEVLPALREGGLIVAGEMSDALLALAGEDASVGTTLKRVMKGTGTSGPGEFHKGEWKWTGVVRVPNSNSNGVEEGKQETRLDRLRAIRAGEGVYRKMDLNLPPYPSLPSALVHLTGDSEFVREMRIRATRMGMWLDEFGLWKRDEGNEDKVSSPQADGAQIDGKTQTVAKGEDPAKEQEEEGQRTNKGVRWTLVHTPTESELFAELGMQWLSPERRNYTYLLSRYSKSSGKYRRGGDMAGDVGVGVVLHK